MGMTATTKLCYCGDEPANAVDSWDGEPVGEYCASLSRVQTEPLTVQDITVVLRAAVVMDGSEAQDEAVERLARLLTYQQRRIEALEAAVAKLTKEDS